jgi:hypothetical protein
MRAIEMFHLECLHDVLVFLENFILNFNTMRVYFSTPQSAMEEILSTEDSITFVNRNEIVYTNVSAFTKW